MDDNLLNSEVATEPEHESPARADVGDIPASKAPPVGLSLAWLLWDHRRFLAKWTIAGTLTTLVIALLLPNRYESTTQLMPPTQTDFSAAMLSSALDRADPLGLASQLVGLRTSGALVIGVLRSRTVEETIVKRFDLQHVYGKSRLEDACKELAADTAVAEDRRSGIISIAVTDKDPYRAQAIAGALVQELNRSMTGLTTSAAHRERVFLEQRLSAVKQELDTSSIELSRFSSKNATIDVSTQGRTMLEAVARLQGELIAAEAQLRELEQIYTVDNVRVRSLRARVEELRRQLSTLGGYNATGATPGQGMYPSLRELPLLGATYADLYRTVKIQEAIYEVLTKQYELAKVAEAKEVPSVKVLDAPDLPQRKVSPHRAILTVIGAILSLLGAVLWTVGRRSWRYLEPGDPRKLLGSEILAVVTSYPRRLGARIAGRRSAIPK